MTNEEAMWMERLKPLTYIKVFKAIGNMLLLALISTVEALVVGIIAGFLILGVAYLFGSNDPRVVGQWAGIIGLIWGFVCFILNLPRALGR